MQCARVRKPYFWSNTATDLKASKRAAKSPTSKECTYCSRLSKLSPIAHGFLYLVAVMDWASRHVLAWRLSNTLDARFCVDALEAALAKGRPDIFNTDQGCQFTSVAFTGTLAAAGIAISMGGRGRWMDNVFVERLWRSLKYEEVYLHAYDSPADARRGIGAWIEFYNSERPHQALGDRTPAAVFAAGASPVDLWTTQARCPQAPQAPQQQQILYDDEDEGIAIMRRARLTTAEPASTSGGFHLIPA